MMKVLLSLWKSMTVGDTIGIVGTSTVGASCLFVMTSNDLVSSHILISNR